MIARFAPHKSNKPRGAIRGFFVVLGVELHERIDDRVHLGGDADRELFCGRDKRLRARHGRVLSAVLDACNKQDIMLA